MVGSLALKMIQERGFPAVREVRDAKRSLKINITKEDSEQSLPKNHQKCAMSMACRDAFEADGVITSRAMAYLIKGAVATRYVLSNRAVAAVKSFDRGKGFAEGYYYLAAPAATQKLGVKKHYTGTGGDRENYRRTKRRKIARADDGIRAALRSGKLLYA